MLTQAMLVRLVSPVPLPVKTELVMKALVMPMPETTLVARAAVAAVPALVA